MQGGEGPSSDRGTVPVREQETAERFGRTCHLDARPLRGEGCRMRVRSEYCCCVLAGAPKVEGVASSVRGALRKDDRR